MTLATKPVRHSAPLTPSTMSAEQSASNTASSRASGSRPPSISSASSVSNNEDALPVGAPSSTLFEIRNTLNAGRAVFASKDIEADELIWQSDDLTLSVLYREYRREVCGQCFKYDYGRDLDVRDKSVGFAFCSKACREKWTGEQGEIGVAAWEAVEKLLKNRSKEDSEMVDIDLPRPQAKEITQAWEAAYAQAKLIHVARSEGQTPCTEDVPVQPVTKAHRKALSKALQQKISPDVMSFCLSGILWHHHSPASWPKLLALADDATPYHSTDDLHSFTRTYLHLLCILPIPLLPLVTPETLFLLSSRDSHNAFGIRSLEDDGSEFFGYGCWPAASYFNHSCGPNVEKKRNGRVWEFRAGRSVRRGEELCITYLSGEERGWEREKRMETLRRSWGFDCECGRCSVEKV